MDSSTLLYIAGLFFILGAGIVGLIWIMVVLTRRILNKRKDSPSQDQNLSEVARLMRDTQTQDLVVEMDGNTFKTASELSPAQQRRLGFTASVLTKWLTQPPPTTTEPTPDLPTLATSDDWAEPAVLAEIPDTAMQPAAAPVPVPQPAPEADPLGLNQTPEYSDWIPAESVPTLSTDHHIPPFATEPTPEVKPVSTQLPDVVGGILNPTPTPAPVFKSIAMQINDILQARILGTPFEKRGIIVSDGPDHGVLVTLDGQKYPGVKDVPDDEVRDLIRSSVLDWEKQSKTSSK